MMAVEKSVDLLPDLLAGMNVGLGDSLSIGLIEVPIVLKPIRDTAMRLCGRDRPKAAGQHWQKSATSVSCRLSSTTVLVAGLLL